MTPEHRKIIRELFRMEFGQQQVTRLGLFIDIENWIIDKMEHAYSQNQALQEIIEQLEKEKKSLNAN